MKKDMNRNDVISKMIRNYEEKKLYSKCNTDELTSMYIEFCTKTLKRTTPRKTSFVNDLNELGFKCYEHQTCKFINENPFEV